MADAMCGPSNPLQQFKQQTDLDRTLQQDRLSSRRSPAQGFRSQNTQAGLLDPEFEAFQAGVDPSLLAPLQPFQQPITFSGPSSQAPSWANDFHRLQISPQPVLAQPSRPWQAGADASAWAQGFREQIAQSVPRAQSSSPSPQAFQQRARHGLTGFQSAFAQPAYAQPSYMLDVQSKGKEPVTDQFDDAAFARAFDQAREDMVVDTTSSTVTDRVEKIEEHLETSKSDELIDVSEQSEQDWENEWRPEQMIHASDIEHVPEEVLSEEQPKDNQQRQEDDALAATAQELLRKVEHNQSEKFKNSQFLGLMRRLRDREVRVEGDQMVETATASRTDVSDQALSPNSSALPSSSVQGQASESTYGHVDTRPHDYGLSIPQHEQDHDTGRLASNDGQGVVDLLNQPDFTEDIGMSDHLPQGPSFEDDEPEEPRAFATPAQPTSLPDVLYRAGGPLEGWDSPS